jgi:hypothetical protein
MLFSLQFICLHIVLYNRKTAFNIVGPAAYYVAGISLPLVAWFITSHISDLKGPSKTKFKKI